MLERRKILEISNHTSMVSLLAIYGNGCQHKKVVRIAFMMFLGVQVYVEVVLTIKK